MTFKEKAIKQWNDFKAHPIREILIILAKQFGRVWIFAAIPFRAYARNYVYNYVLQTAIYDYDGWRTTKIKRLNERKPVWHNGLKCWQLADIHNVGRGGIIKYRKVNKVVFYFIVFLIWGWLDDDANQDLSDSGYCQSLVSGERKDDLAGKLYGKQLAKIDWSAVKFGNVFDLGDVRSQYPFYNFWAVWVWNNRNTAMNFQYLFANY